MSLINEALRKARQQASEQEAKGGGRPDLTNEASRRAARSMMPARGTNGVGLGLLLGLVLGLGIVFGAMVMRWLVPSGVEQAQTVTPTTPTEVPSPVSPIGGESSPPEPIVVLIATPTPAPEPTATPTPTPTPTPTATPTPRVARTEAGLPLYVLDASLPDGVRLELGYIILTSSWSVAHINGQDLHRGQVVDGWTIERITKDEVELSGPDDDRIVIRTR